MKGKLAATFLFLSTLGMGTPLYYLATGQTGAQTQVDINHSSIWLLTPTEDFSFGGGLFTIKDGNSTSADIILSIYEGVDSGGTLLGLLDLTHTAVCAQVGNCGQFAAHQFFFPAPISLISGITYFATLTSPAADVQSQAYFVKKDSYFISDQAGVAIQPQPVTFGPVAVATPEPQSMLLLAIGFGFLGTRRLHISLLGR